MPPATSPPSALRVLLGPMPKLLHDLIARALAQVPNVEVVGGPREQPFILIARDTAADAIVIADGDDATSGLLESLLSGCPWASVVVVVVSDDHDDHLTRFELWPRRVDFGDPSEEHLLSALRTATPWARRLAAPERLAP